MLWLSGKYFPINAGKHPDSEPDITGKDQIIAGLQEAFELSYQRVEATPESDLAEIVPFFAGDMSKLQILNLMQDHVTHHRGQLIVYLNLLDIPLPRYSGW